MGEFHSGYVTMAGRPNVGKSTLLNRLVGQKIAITSNKPETTRDRIKAIYTDPDKGQVIFTDTPGIHKARNRLGEFMMDAVRKALGDVDLILYLIEPVTEIRDNDRKIAKTLIDTGVPVFLVINKADTVPRDKLLPVIDIWKTVGDFKEIVPVSAYNGTGTDDLLNTIFRYLPEGPMYYSEDAVTDETERDIASEIIREKSLYALNDEVPHGIAVSIEKMRKRDGRDLVDIEATIYCERESHKGIIIGKSGSMLKRIGSDSRYELEKMLGMKVNLKLWVKVQKGWRDRDADLRRFGYRKDED